MKTTYIINAKYINPKGFDYILFSLTKDFINENGERTLRTLFNGCLALPFKATNKTIATVINIDEVDTVDIDALVKRIKEDLIYETGEIFNNSVILDTKQLTIELTRKGD